MTMWGPHYDGWGWGFGLIWGLLNLLFWAAIFGLAIWAVLRLSRSSPQPRPPVGPAGPGFHPHRESPREILDRRFASGEIDAHTYEDMRARLEGTAEPAARPAPAAPGTPAPQPGPAAAAATPPDEDQTEQR
ncbi:MAG TPA: SHOCT domain-containing protein [Glycomyces sp.]|nr:SHOCT domain-containing protein [Glycomyces sp.]